MKNITKKEITIGICVIAALAVLFFGIEFLKGINIFKPANYYVATYTDVAGLQVSAPVSVNGFKVGQVRDINYLYDNPGHVEVEMSLDKDLRVPQGTIARIQTSLLGTAEITLVMSAHPDYHNVGDHLVGETASSLMDNVNNSIMPSVDAIVPKIDSLLTSLNRLVADPALASAVKRLDDISANLDKTMRQLNATVGRMPAVMDNVNTVASNLATTSADLTAISADIRSLPIDSTMQNILQTSQNIRELTEQLNDPNSSLGQLMHDRQLYDNLNQCASSLDSLLIDIRRNPKRYISIKLL